MGKIILFGIIVVLVIVLTRKKEHMDEHIIKNYCRTWAHNPDQANYNKNETIEAIQHLIDKKIIDTKNLKPGESDSAIRHNCAYFDTYL